MTFFSKLTAYSTFILAFVSLILSILTLVNTQNMDNSINNNIDTINNMKNKLRMFLCDKTTKPWINKTCETLSYMDLKTEQTGVPDEYKVFSNEFCWNGKKCVNVSEIKL
jgi:hypothetical protein